MWWSAGERWPGVRRSTSRLAAFIFLLWKVVVGGFVVLADPLIGLPVAVGLAAFLLGAYLLRPWGNETRARRWATLRLRSLSGPALQWTLMAVPTLLLLGWPLGD